MTRDEIELLYDAITIARNRASLVTKIASNLSDDEDSCPETHFLRKVIADAVTAYGIFNDFLDDITEWDNGFERWYAEEYGCDGDGLS